MKLQDKIVLGHRGFFNAHCRKMYRENSKEVCRISTTKKHIHIIELDLRKSKDGVLYCYHGGLFHYCFTSMFLKDFSYIKKSYNVDALKDILNVITSDKIIFLDIKDKNITRDDILNVFKGEKFREVILGNKSVLFLKKFNNMPKQFVKILNGNIFCKFYNLAKLKNLNYKYFEVVFPFQINDEIIKKVHDHGLEFRCAGLFFVNRQHYINTIKKYEIKHVSSDFID
ncbi:hypothetical protein HYY69_04730 [Candidatus Woesearchaeota archaeon]|nr:hypothetical protein [Candidatus Woesearchaeota archaeon]